MYVALRNIAYIVPFSLSFALFLYLSRRKSPYGEFLRSSLPPVEFVSSTDGTMGDNRMVNCSS